MKKIKETTKKINELAGLTGEDREAILRRVGVHLLKQIESLPKKENNNAASAIRPYASFFAAGGLPPRRITRTITITETVEVS